MLRADTLPLKATVNEAYSLPSQRGLSKSSAGRLPFPFPVGQSGRVYFEPPANNVDGPVQNAKFNLCELIVLHLNIKHMQDHVNQQWHFAAVLTCDERVPLAVRVW